MAIVLTVIGAVLVGLAIQDLFHTLFHPVAMGDVGDWIAHNLWRVFRRFFPRFLTLAGPLAFAAVVAYWGVSVVLGFALVYLPRLPQAFTFASGLDGSSYGSFWGALNVSLGALITLSTGAYSTRHWIQFLMGMESVLGFALLTASVSWLLSIYPVFEHRKSLAHEATLLHFAELNGNSRVRNFTDNDLQQLLFGFASQVITSRNELAQFPITYYFHENEQSTALAGVFPYLADMAEQNLQRNGAAGLAAVSLGGAIDDYLKLVADSFLDCEFKDRREVMRAFAHDHMRKIVRSPDVMPRAA